jgi:hypothetical protein
MRWSSPLCLSSPFRSPFSWIPLSPDSPVVLIPLHPLSHLGSVCKHCYALPLSSSSSERYISFFFLSSFLCLLLFGGGGRSSRGWMNRFQFASRWETVSSSVHERAVRISRRQSQICERDAESVSTREGRRDEEAGPGCRFRLFP